MSKRKREETFINDSSTDEESTEDDSTDDDFFNEKILNDNDLSSSDEEDESKIEYDSSDEDNSSSDEDDFFKETNISQKNKSTREYRALKRHHNIKSTFKNNEIVLLDKPNDYSNDHLNNYSNDDLNDKFKMINDKKESNNKESNNGESNNKESNKRFNGIIRQIFTINNIHYRIEPVPGDGNCMLYAILLAVNNSYSVEYIRILIGNYMLENRSNFIEYYVASDHDDKSFEEYVDLIKTTNEWCDNMCLIAIQYILNRPIHVFQDNNGELSETNNVTIDNNNTPIFIFYNGENHYDAIIQLSIDYNTREVDKLELSMNSKKEILSQLSKKNLNIKLLNNEIFKF